MSGSSLLLFKWDLKTIAQHLLTYPETGAQCVGGGFGITALPSVLRVLTGMLEMCSLPGVIDRVDLTWCSYLHSPNHLTSVSPSPASSLNSTLKIIALAVKNGS